MVDLPGFTIQNLIFNDRNNAWYFSQISLHPETASSSVEVSFSAPRSGTMQ
jgi:hypothetical protein